MSAVFYQSCIKSRSVELCKECWNWHNDRCTKSVLQSFIGVLLCFKSVRFYYLYKCFTVYCDSCDNRQSPKFCKSVPVLNSILTGVATLNYTVPRGEFPNRVSSYSVPGRQFIKWFIHKLSCLNYRNEQKKSTNSAEH